MKNGAYYQYYVEGDDEKKLLEVLKRDLRCIASGKIEKFNVIQNDFSTVRIRTLKPDTIIIFVYDTDVDKTETLQRNIAMLKRQASIRDVLCIPQVSNLEDELLRACQIRNIRELTRSTSATDFKRDLISCSNLYARLNKCSFDISRFWNRIPANRFQNFGNDAYKIKL